MTLIDAYTYFATQTDKKLMHIGKAPLPRRKRNSIKNYKSLQKNRGIIV